MDNRQLMRQLLDRGWAEDDLRLARAWLERLDADPAALGELREYDRLRQVMTPGAPEADAPDTPDAAPHADHDNVPFEGWPAFERRMIDALDEVDRRGQRHASLIFPRGGWQLGLLAACLTVVAGVGGWWLNQLAQPRAPLDFAPSVSAAAGIPSTAEVAQQVRAFTEVSRVLDHQAAWLSLSEQASDVGLASEPVLPNQRLLLLRLSVHRGEQLVSRSDLIIVPGHTAELTVPVLDKRGQGGKELRYVISVTDDQPARLSLWVELGAPGESSQTLAALATQLQPEPGQVRSAGELVAGSDEYRVKVGFSEPGRVVAPAPRAPREDHL